MDKMSGLEPKGGIVGSGHGQDHRRSQDRSTPALEVEFNERVTTLLEAERASIAREIHDEAGQLLISAAFRLDQAIAMLPQAFVARELLVQARQALDECAEELHRLAFNLRPRMLDDLGLVPALHSYLKRYANLGNIQLQIQLEQPRCRLHGATELAIFRIVQEAVANVRKHSRATVACVRLGFSDDFVEVEIHDNGVGFHSRPPSSRTEPRHQWGLAGMQERVASLGGVLTVKSSTLSGTTVNAKFPARGETDGKPVLPDG
ncbi:MAG: sensor histidine kinase [Chloroflexi bacterium]|nr:sensor histidine kinase [Chloroflexota bacterium]